MNVLYVLWMLILPIKGGEVADEAPISVPMTAEACNEAQMSMGAQTPHNGFVAVFECRPDLSNGPVS